MPFLRLVVEVCCYLIAYITLLSLLDTVHTHTCTSVFYFHCCRDRESPERHVGRKQKTKCVDPCDRNIIFVAFMTKEQVRKKEGKEMLLYFVFSAFKLNVDSWLWFLLCHINLGNTKLKCTTTYWSKIGRIRIEVFFQLSSDFHSC